MGHRQRDCLQVNDTGHITDPLAGRLKPDPATAGGGRGLWVVQQLRSGRDPDQSGWHRHPPAHAPELLIISRAPVVGLWRIRGRPMWLRPVARAQPDDRRWLQAVGSAGNWGGLGSQARSLEFEARCERGGAGCCVTTSGILAPGLMCRPSFFSHDDDASAAAAPRPVTPPEWAEKLREIQSITDAALSRLDPRALLDALVERARDALGADTAAVCCWTGGPASSWRRRRAGWKKRCVRGCGYRWGGFRRADRGPGPPGDHC